VPATIRQIRRIALNLPGVTEGECHGTVAFYARRKFMLRLRDDNRTLVVRLPIPSRNELIRSEPDLFFLTDHYLNYPAVLVNLANATEARLKEIIVDAWRRLASKKQTAAFEEEQ
jgi:hypothetical protein